MSDISDITTLVRYAVDDTIQTQIPGDIFTYSSSAVFTLAEPHAISVSAVLVNDVEIGASNYSYSSSTNKVTISSSLSSGDTIEIQYTYYSNYSDAEIENFIRHANLHLSLNNYQTWEIDTSDNFYPDLTNSEKNLVAIIASILIKPDNVSYRLPDVVMNVPKSLPTRDLVSQAIKKFKHNTTGVFELIDNNTT